MALVVSFFFLFLSHQLSDEDELLREVSSQLEIMLAAIKQVGMRSNSLQPAAILWYLLI